MASATARKQTCQSEALGCSNADVVPALGALAGLDEERPEGEHHTGHRHLVAHLACEDCTHSHSVSLQSTVHQESF